MRFPFKWSVFVVELAGLALVASLAITADNWRTAYELKQSQMVYIGHGCPCWDRSELRAWCWNHAQDGDTFEPIRPRGRQ